jgi:hypothetical protein
METLSIDSNIDVNSTRNPFTVTPESYTEDSSEGNNVAEYEAILGETAAAVLPDATGEDFFLIKPSESEEATEAHISPSVTKEDQIDASPRAASEDVFVKPDESEEADEVEEAPISSDITNEDEIDASSISKSEDAFVEPIECEEDAKEAPCSSFVIGMLTTASSAIRSADDIVVNIPITFISPDAFQEDEIDASPIESSEPTVTKKRRSDKYFGDHPKVTTFASAKARAFKTSQSVTTPKRSNSRKGRTPSKIHKSLYNVSKPQQEEGRRRRKEIEDRLSSKKELRTWTGRSRSPAKRINESRVRSSSMIHESLYNRSVAKQEEGRRRRKEVEEKLSSKNFNRNSSRHRGSHRNEGIFKEEISKSKKKISIYQTDSLYERLMSHNIKTEERIHNLRRESEEREMQWLSDISQRKIPLDQANRIYYRGTVLSRSRSRGREE